MAKGKKARLREKRDKKQGRQMLMIGIGLTIFLVIIIYFLSPKDF